MARLWRRSKLGCPGSLNVIRVDEGAVIAVGRIIDRVAVGVSDAKCESADGAVGGELEGVVDRIGAGFDAGESAVATIRTNQVGIVLAGHKEVVQSSSGDGSPIAERGRDGNASDRVGDYVGTIGSVVGDGGTSGEKGIVRWGNGVELVDISLLCEMRAFTADVCGGKDNVCGSSSDPQVPLLNVRPRDLGGDGNRADWEKEPAACANVRVSRDIVLRRVLRIRSGALLQDFGVSFVAIHVFEENAIASADGHFAVAERIPSEAQTRSRIDEFVLHAAGRGAGSAGVGAGFGAALNVAVVLIADELPLCVGDERAGIGIDGRSVGGGPQARRKAELLVEFFLVAAEELQRNPRLRVSFLVMRQSSWK